MEKFMQCIGKYLILSLLLLPAADKAMVAPPKPNQANIANIDDLTVIKRGIRAIVEAMQTIASNPTEAKKRVMPHLESLANRLQALPSGNLKQALLDFYKSVSALLLNPNSNTLFNNFSIAASKVTVALQEQLKKQPNETPEKARPQVRKIPPLSPIGADTVIFVGGKIKSVHPEGKLFSDNEIVEKLDIIKSVEIGPKVYASYTKHGKAIIQQQAMRGCTAAVTAMLIMDDGKKPDLSCLQGRNLGNDEDQIKDLQNAGLKARINSANSLSELRNLIIQNGSAIVSISGKIGNHVIVVDEISKDLSKVRLRDPYHGWEITITSEAFLKEWHGGKSIQVIKERK